MDRQAKRKKNFLNTAKGYLPGIVVRQIQAIPQTLYLVDYGPIANQKPSQRVAHCEFSVIHCFSAGSSRGLTRFHRQEGVELGKSDGTKFHRSFRMRGGGVGSGFFGSRYTTLNLTGRDSSLQMLAKYISSRIERTTEVAGQQNPRRLISEQTSLARFSGVLFAVKTRFCFVELTCD